MKKDKHSLPWELLQRANRMIRRRNIMILALVAVIAVQNFGGVIHFVV